MIFETVLVAQSIQLRITAIFVQAAYLPLPERQSISIHGSTFACPTSNVVVARKSHVRPGLLSELVGVSGDDGKDIMRYAFDVDFHLVPSILAAPIFGFRMIVHFRHGFATGNEHR